MSVLRVAKDQLRNCNYLSLYRVDPLRNITQVLLSKVETHQCLLKYSFLLFRMKIPHKYPLNLEVLVVVGARESRALLLTRDKQITENQQSFLRLCIYCGTLSLPGSRNRHLNLAQPIKICQLPGHHN